MTRRSSPRPIRRFGWPGLLGGLLWGLCLGLYLIQVQPARQEIEAYRLRSTALEARLDELRQASQGHGQSAEQQLAEFYKVFPRVKDSAELIARMVRIMRRHGLTLETGEYKALPDNQGKLTRLQMLLPVRGSYPQIRACLVDLTREMPGLAIEQVRFAPRQDGEYRLDARLSLLAFLGQPT
jgi:hypothetical protein